LLRIKAAKYRFSAMTLGIPASRLAQAFPSSLPLMTDSVEKGLVLFGE
jgi:hypothetical protein